jgi:Transcriptional regulator containing an amidase domain and an AraC-type DNA-binding HTH domain
VHCWIESFSIVFDDACIQCSDAGEKAMRVAVNLFEPEIEPHISVQQAQVLAVALRPGSFESGERRSEMTRYDCYTGQMILSRRNTERWVRTHDLQVLAITISDAALAAVGDGTSSEFELRRTIDLRDARIGALVRAVNAERISGFPSGRLFLDSVEQALAVALVNGFGVSPPPLRIYRSGLTPARLRKVTELVHAKFDEDLTLEQLAEAVGLGRTRFSQMFRKSTGQSPHQFVLGHRIERAKEMLRSAEMRILDVAVACGFKTQQHFARVFRHLCGISPTEYRQERLR